MRPRLLALASACALGILNPHLPLRASITFCVTLYFHFGIGFVTCASTRAELSHFSVLAVYLYILQPHPVYCVHLGTERDLQSCEYIRAPSRVLQPRGAYTIYNCRRPV